MTVPPVALQARPTKKRAIKAISPEAIHRIPEFANRKKCAIEANSAVLLHRADWTLSPSEARDRSQFSREADSLIPTRNGRRGSRIEGDGFGAIEANLPAMRPAWERGLDTG